MAPYRCRLCSTSAPVSPFGWFDMTVLRLNDAIAWPGPCVRTGLMTEAVRFGADGIRISAPFSFVSAPGQRYKNSAGEKRTVVFRKTGVYGRERKIEKSLVPRPTGSRSFTESFRYGRLSIGRARRAAGKVRLWCGSRAFHRCPSGLGRSLGLRPGSVSFRSR